MTSTDVEGNRKPPTPATAVTGGRTVAWADLDRFAQEIGRSRYTVYRVITGYQVNTPDVPIVREFERYFGFPMAALAKFAPRASRRVVRPVRVRHDGKAAQGRRG